MNSDKYEFTYDEREINLLDSLPQVYHPIYDFRSLTSASGREIHSLYNGLTKLVNDQFINTASSDALAKWEKYLGITPNGTDTLDERRFRILAKLNDNPPYTDEYLVKKLNELCGKDCYRITREYANYKLTIDVSLDSIANTNSVMEIVRNIVPANIELTVQSFRTRNYEVAAFTHDQLAKYTHDGIELGEMLA